MRRVSMKKICTALMMLLWITTSSANDELNAVLDGFHQAAAEANYQRYFDLLAEDAIFLGTDASERWTKSAFKAFVKPYFSQGKGWLYVATKRNLSTINDSNIVFFDELLHSESYGQCRGSGLLIKENNQWKILQYNLSIPLPNHLAKSIVGQIKASPDKK